MLANTITIARILLTFGVIALLGVNRSLDIALILTIGVIFLLDAVDGIVARKRNETSETGAVLDTLADRMIENTFWIYFTAAGCLPVWMPIAVMARGFITDSLQRFFRYPENGWTHGLTRSRFSRGLYGAVKMLTFMSLASAPFFTHDTLEIVSHGLATMTVLFCLLRGVPFFFIRKTSCPQNP